MDAAQADRIEALLLRLDGKLDILITALAEDGEGEDLAQLDLDGRQHGKERQPGQSLG